MQGEDVNHTNTTGPAAPGDRFPTSEPCCPACCLLHQSNAPRPTYLAIAPYSFIFRAPAKGRWLGLPLLSLCVQEFTYVPPPPPPQAAAATAAASQEEVVSASPPGGPMTVATATTATTLDSRITLPAYVEELSNGLLWLHGRESECRAAGESYKQCLRQLCADAVQLPVPAPPGGEEHHDDEVSWHAVKAWLGRMPCETAVHAVMRNQLPQLLPLRQKDIVMHRVWRQEGRLYANEPLHILRCDLVQREANRAGPDSGFRPALLVLNKPPGLPVHPSGRYRKNSCTSILEDVFGGCDAHLYDIQEEEFGENAPGGQAAPRRARVVHRQHGFPLITVDVRVDGGGGGVSLADWALLKRLFRSHGSSTSAVDASPALAPLKAFVVHRLDAPTSGVLLFALDQPTARATATLIAQKGAEEDDACGTTQDAGSAERSCAKTYLATVHGRLDAATLTRPDGGLPHGCRWNTDRHVGGNDAAAPSPYSSPTAGGSRGERWLRVGRPIGCLSFHQSLYWCPGEARAAQWLRERAQEGSAASAGEPLPTGGDGPTTAETARNGRAAAVAAKREAMRRQSMRGRGAKRARGDGEGEEKRKDGSTDDDATAVYATTLRTATTLLRAVRYSAERDETVVACRLLTGRSHQLRVHLASLGHPIVGDEKYVQLVAALSTARATGNSPAHCHDDDDVSLYYNQLLGKGSSAGEPGEASSSSPDNENGACVCPQRICLHAWRYELTYPPPAEVAMEFVAPPYEPWMRAEAERMDEALR